MNRQQRAELGRKTLGILSEGWYTAPSGQKVDISGSLRDCVLHTRLWRPWNFPEDFYLTPPARGKPYVEVVRQTTLEVLEQIAPDMPYDEPVSLNFASAKNPGGGFLSGAWAQEESLARSSGLYASLASQREMYEYNRRLKTSLYSDYMIHSPRVPVFFYETGELRETPYHVSFISASAVNAAAIRKNEPENVLKIHTYMAQRLMRVLWVARQMGHKTVILGAWGCGVFGNDPEEVAGIYREMLGPGGLCRGWFDHIVYAIHDQSYEQKTFNAFYRI